MASARFSSRPVHRRTLPAFSCTICRMKCSLASRVFAAHLTIPSSNGRRSEEHTSELQSLMRISYAVFCLKKKKHTTITSTQNRHHLQHITNCLLDIINQTHVSRMTHHNHY